MILKEEVFISIPAILIRIPLFNIKPRLEAIANH
jgi:hypothetical protein